MRTFSMMPRAFGILLIFLLAILPSFFCAVLNDETQMTKGPDAAYSTMSYLDERAVELSPTFGTNPIPLFNYHDYVVRTKKFIEKNRKRRNPKTARNDDIQKDNDYWRKETLKWKKEIEKNMKEIEHYKKENEKLKAENAILDRDRKNIFQRNDRVDATAMVTDDIGDFD
eukprot:25444_1